MFTYLHNGETHTVQLERLPDGSYKATVNGRTHLFRAETVEGGWSLAFPESGARMTTYGVADGETRWVHLHGETYTLTRETTRAGRRSASLGGQGGAVTAQMPGQVREVLVLVGDAVTSGQALVILEAMKMEVRAVSPADGKVKRVLVSAGDVVSRGQVLVEIE